MPGRNAPHASCQFSLSDVESPVQIPLNTGSSGGKDGSNQQFASDWQAAATFSRTPGTAPEADPIATAIKTAVTMGRKITFLIGVRYSVFLHRRARAVPHRGRGFWELQQRGTPVGHA